MKLYWILFRLSFYDCSSCVYHCDDQSSSDTFSPVQIYDLSYIHLYSSPSTSILRTHNMTSSYISVGREHCTGTAKVIVWQIQISEATTKFSLWLATARKLLTRAASLYKYVLFIFKTLRQWKARLSLFTHGGRGCVCVHNQNISFKQKLKRNRDQRRRFGSSLTTFYNITRVLVNTMRQSLINWPLWRGYFGSLGSASMDVVERWLL